MVQAKFEYVTKFNKVPEVQAVLVVTQDVCKNESLKRSKDETYF
jgi:hypothetical protein